MKLPRFAEAGIPEVWIEDLEHDVLLVYRNPNGAAYETKRILRSGELISPLAFPDAAFRIDGLLSLDCAR